jgi:hypothetical protein
MIEEILIQILCESVALISICGVSDPKKKEISIFIYNVLMQKARRNPGFS